MTSVDAPWVAVFIPDDDLSLRKEATGTTQTTKAAMWTGSIGVN